MTGKLPAPEVFGPQGAHVVALIERARRLTPDEVSALGAARDAALGAARAPHGTPRWTPRWAPRGAPRGAPRAGSLSGTSSPPRTTTCSWPHNGK